LSKVRGVLIWAALMIAVAIPVSAAIMSPLLEYRSPIYIAAGFSGVIGMTLLLFQPLLAAGYLPGLTGRRGRRMHQLAGILLVVLILLHIAGLWITSPPDVIDALLFVSPTPFSVWGVIAMWATFAAACLAALRRTMRLQPRTWRWSHKTFVTFIVSGTVVHALKIEGTMEFYSKVMLCALVISATVLALIDYKFKRRASTLPT